MSIRTVSLTEPLTVLTFDNGARDLTIEYEDKALLEQYPLYCRIGERYVDLHNQHHEYLFTPEDPGYRWTIGPADNSDERWIGPRFFRLTISEGRTRSANKHWVEFNWDDQNRVRAAYVDSTVGYAVLPDGSRTCVSMHLCPPLACIHGDDGVHL